MIKKKVRGKYGWMPSPFVDEIKDIKREDGIKGDAAAIKEMVKYTRVGREAKRLYTLDFTRAVPRPSLVKKAKKCKKWRLEI